ncbi:hypothetical protein KO504_16905 [Winogradskyella psychrotolerans]|uniref:hypothetical protein n=1 Tax=Winogradskyella psychrotolerans TaxID=1344585 RepID=UPI001C0704DD|nr:hypothetical protein [Winogradskyella psychrotolerans]MBU2923031.1 hypothetical protein [Winogradskyella psychrotolerans]
MNTEHQIQLEALVNNTYNYKGKTLNIKSFKQVSGTYVILTSGQTLTCYPSELESLIKQLVLVESYQAVAPPSQTGKVPEVPVQFTYQKSNTHIKLENALSTVLDEVQKEEKAIPKAKALCEIANAMINVEKQQLAFLKATKQI